MEIRLSVIYVAFKIPLRLAKLKLPRVKTINANNPKAKQLL
jgi:hypothetical protein